LTRKEIRALFHGHVSNKRLDLALEELTRSGLASRETAPGRGSPATRWTGADDSEAHQEAI
jgi:hypothetical protein